VPKILKVTIKGQFGLDEPDRMLDELKQVPERVPWEMSEDDQERFLGGTLELIVYTAVVSDLVGRVLDRFITDVKQVTEDWRERRHKAKPEVCIEIETVPDGPVAGHRDDSVSHDGMDV
jgi:hypothetical protein